MTAHTKYGILCVFAVACRFHAVCHQCQTKDVDVMIRFPRIHAAICQTIIRLPGAFLPPENHPRRASEHRIVRKQEHRRYIVNTCLIDGDLAAPVQSRLQCRAVFLRRIVYRKSVYHFSSVVLWDAHENKQFRHYYKQNSGICQEFHKKRTLCGLFP